MFRLCQDIAKLEILKKKFKEQLPPNWVKRKNKRSKHNKKVYVTHQIQLREGMDGQT